MAEPDQLAPLHVPYEGSNVCVATDKGCKALKVWCMSRSEGILLSSDLGEIVFCAECLNPTRLNVGCSHETLVKELQVIR